MKKLINRIKDWLLTPVKESSEFTGEERVLDRYGDFKKVGEWICEDGGDGIVYMETVKFMDRQGRICIGTDWVLKNAAEDIN